MQRPPSNNCVVRTADERTNSMEGMESCFCESLITLKDVALSEGSTGNEVSQFRGRRDRAAMARICLR